MTTLRDEDITTTPTATLPGGDADQGDSQEQVDPAGGDPGSGGDADQSDSDSSSGGGDADQSDS